MRTTGILGLVLACSLMSGCASLVSNAASGLADSLTSGILNNDDPGCRIGAGCDQPPRNALRC